MAKATGPAGHVRSATYAPQLHVTTATDPASTATFGYDPAVNGGESLTSTRSATGAGNSSAYGTTPDHQVPAHLRRRRPGTASTYTYNGAGNRMSASSAAAAQAIITRDPDGTVATSTSPTGAATSCFCDDPGQLTSTTPPTGTTLGERSYTHDGYVRVATYTSGRGVTAALRRPRPVLEVDYSDTTPTVTHTYDDRGSIDTAPTPRAPPTTVTTHWAAHQPHAHRHPRRPTAVTRPATSPPRPMPSAPPATAVTPATGSPARSPPPGGPSTSPTPLPGDAPTPGPTWPATATAPPASPHTPTPTTTPPAGSPGCGRPRPARHRPGQRPELLLRLPGTAACAGAPATGADTALRWTSTDDRTGKVTTHCYDRADRLISATTPGGDTWAYTYDVNGSLTETRKNGAVVQSLAVDRGDQNTTAGHVGQRRGGGEGHGLRSGRQSTVTVQCSVVWPWRSVRLTGPDTIMVLQSGVPSGPHPWASRSSHDSAAVLLCNTQPG